MTDAKITKAEAKLAAAQSVMEQAIETGVETVAARAAVDGAQEALNALQDAAKDRAGDEAHQVRELAAGELEAFVDGVLSGITKPRIARPDTGGAASIVQARQDDTQARADLDAVVGKLETLQTRLASTKADRQAIVDRRALGEHQDGDGTLIGLADADIEGLNALIQRTDASREKLLAASGVARANLGRWEKSWSDSQQRAKVETLRDLAAQVEGALLAIAQKWAEPTLGGARQNWNPAQPLTDLLHGIGLRR